jgi:peptide/nickel transport system substrate-binding protein
LEGYRAGTQGFGYMFWGPDYIDPGDYVAFLPERLVGLRVRWTEAEADPAAVELRDRAETVTAPEERTQVFADMQDYLQESGPFAPFMQPGVQLAYRSELEGVHFHIQWLIDVAEISRADA